MARSGSTRQGRSLLGRTLIKRDDQGRPVFFPWGAFGPGYVLPEGTDVAALDRERRWVVWGLIIALVLASLWSDRLLYALAAAGGVAGIVRDWIRVQGLERSDEKLTFREAADHAARTTSRPMLLAMSGLSLLMAIGSVGALVATPSQWPIAVLGALFFGGGFVWTVALSDRQRVLEHDAPPDARRRG